MGTGEKLQILFRSNNDFGDYKFFIELDRPWIISDYNAWVIIKNLIKII